MDKFQIHGLPERDALLELDAADVGGLILAWMHKEAAQSQTHALSRYNFTLAFSEDKEVQIALAEAWSWLVTEVLIVEQPANQDGWYVLSRRGRRINNPTDFEKFKHSTLLPRKMLHPTILSAVSADFARGEFDSAVFKAFKELEVAVRKTANYDDSVFGRPLMAKAFDPDNGPLRDTGAGDQGERHALRDLFTGALGSYKNPHSHRKVAVEPQEAAEMIILSSHLMSIVDSRKPAVV